MHDILTNSYKIDNCSEPFEYTQILKDNSIKGKFKYILSTRQHLNASNTSGTSAGLIQYLMKYGTHDNTVFTMFLTNNKYKLKNNEYYEDILSYTLPSFPFINYECNYKGVTLWISRIFTTKYICDSNANMPNSVIILSIDSDCKTHDDFLKTNFLETLKKDAKIWYMTNTLGEEYKEDDYIDIYTYTDGYWDLKKSNNVRSKDTLFIDTTFYNKLICKIEQFQLSSTKEIYKRLNIAYKLNVLLHGPPGTGKTSFIEVIASKLKRNIRFLQITPKITDDQFSSSIAKLGNNDILVCEDIDCLFVDRKKSDTSKNAMTFSGLLNCFDGINSSKSGLIVFLTTNHKCHLDNALIRPGRVDISQEFTYMTKSSILEMTKFYFKENFDLDDFEKFYNIIQSSKITGAILSNYLLDLLLNETYLLYANRKKLLTILKDNDYENNSRIERQMYT